MFGTSPAKVNYSPSRLYGYGLGAGVGYGNPYLYGTGLARSTPGTGYLSTQNVVTAAQEVLRRSR